MESTTESSKREFTKSDLLKLANAGVILALLTGCGKEGAFSTSPDPSPKPEAPTSAPIEETEKPDGIEDIAIEEIPTPTEVVAPEYTVTPDIENFREAYIPVEELLDGSYFRWLKDEIAPTLVSWFQEHEDKIKDVKVDSLDLASGEVFIFDTSTRPNFEDPETAPFKRDVTFGYTTTQEFDESILEAIDSDTLIYMIYPVFYYDKKTQQVHPVITVTPIFTEDRDLIDEINRTYLNDMNLTIIHTSNTLFGRVEPIVRKSFDKVGRDEMRNKMQRYYDGDFSALSDEDVVLLTQVYVSGFYK